ncbi:dipeptidase [Streptomyces sp. NPDC093225]|uniref:dipeptidase n=1 Tax=Streptomyces sp. NPDC093225 TaxID=3366034 RepID=UPI0038138F08
MTGANAMAHLQDEPHHGPGAVRAVGAVDGPAPDAGPDAVPVPVRTDAGDRIAPRAEPPDRLLVAPPRLLPPDPLPAPPPTAPATPLDPSDAERVAALLAKHPVADGYNSLPWTLQRQPCHDLETSESTIDTDLPRLRAGGVGAQFWSLRVPEPWDDGTDRAPDRWPDPGTDAVVSQTLDLIDTVRTLVRRHPDSLLLALGPDELTDARNRGRIACFLGPVPGRTLTDSHGPLRAFHALGVRSLAPAGAAWAEPDLTSFGHEVVREMNRLAMLLDLAGCGPDAARRLVAASRAPVLVSHAGAAALHPHPSNVADEVLTALRAAKGLCMVSFAPELLGPAAGGGPATVTTVADHLDHVRAVAGPECVGLAGTFGTDPLAARVQGLEDPSGYPRLIAELLRRGWPDSELALLTWGNAQRVLREAECTARAGRHRSRP